MEEQQTQGTDDLEKLFEEPRSGSEDVEKSDQLSLEELNALAGRKDNPFKSKEEYQKHYEGLKSLAGDQEAIKERKAQKELEKKTAEEKTLKEELDQVKKDLAKKDFLVEAPTAKDFLDVVEAYAEKNGMTLVEAWNSEKFKSIAEASTRVQKNVTTNNRITPVQAQISKLAEEAKTTGTEDSKINLVKEYFK